MQRDRRHLPCDPESQRHTVREVSGSASDLAVGRSHMTRAAAVRVQGHCSGAMLLLRTHSTHFFATV
jgi:hypothetical protein